MPPAGINSGLNAPLPFSPSAQPPPFQENSEIPTLPDFNPEGFETNLPQPPPFKTMPEQQLKPEPMEYLDSEQPLPAPPTTSSRASFEDLWSDEIKSESFKSGDGPPPFLTPDDLISGEEDIKQLTESTMKISEAKAAQDLLNDNLQWSVNEPTLKPLPAMLDRNEATFEIDTNSINYPPPFSGPFSEPSKAPSHIPDPPPIPDPSPISDPNPIAAKTSQGLHDLPDFRPSPNSQLLDSQIESMVERQVEIILEKMAKKVLPEIAEKLIKQEIHKLLSEQ
jgi:hypothetical protein